MQVGEKMKQACDRTRIWYPRLIKKQVKKGWYLAVVKTLDGRDRMK